jgi:hypothetical protein
MLKTNKLVFRLEWRDKIKWVAGCKVAKFVIWRCTNVGNLTKKRTSSVVAAVV